MNKKELVFGVVALAVLVGLLWYGGNTSRDKNGPQVALDTVVEYFTEEAWRITVEKVGQPIEGFRPSMFMQAFPGLIASDFNNVKAELGVYYVDDGEVKYRETEPQLNSVAEAITSEGMQTLLLNISQRLGIEVRDRADVDTVIKAILEKETSSVSTPGDKPVNQRPPQDDGYVCTMDAKLCPDGSSVGRSGPRCEFAKCPGETDAGYRTCPDEWIVNKMPGIVGQNDTPREYFIIDGMRWEIDGFDMNYVRNNCSVEPQEVY